MTELWRPEVDRRNQRASADGCLCSERRLAPHKNRVRHDDMGEQCIAHANGEVGAARLKEAFERLAK
jgi:hypothetical protein